MEIIDIAENSILSLYGDDLTSRKYITNPAIEREEEIKKLLIVLLTPEKSALLIGKAGIGKTSIVEGLAYKIQNNDVPDVIKNYKVIKLNSSSLVGKITNNGTEELVISSLVRNIKNITNTILFIDEIHTLIGNDTMDLANILKPVLDRGDIKVIGATTDIEYNNYVVKDRAFLRRFEKIDINEPSEATTSIILLKSIPKYESKTGIKFKYNNYVTGMLMDSIVSATSTYKRVYGLAAMYPDVAFSVLSQAFSNALYQNKSEVDIKDVYDAIKNSKRIYPDSIYKELLAFKEKFSDLIKQENIELENVTLEQLKKESSQYI